MNRWDKLLCIANDILAYIVYAMVILGGLIYASVVSLIYLFSNSRGDMASINFLLISIFVVVVIRHAIMCTIAMVHGWLEKDHYWYF